MDLREFYDRTDGDFEGAMQRFSKEERVAKFVRMFPNDPCCVELESCLAKNDVKGAFRAVHTLKGVCLNLSFSGLYKSVYEVTEALRHADPENVEDMERVHTGMESLRRDYDAVIQAVRGLDT